MFCQCKEEGCILSNVRTNILNHHHLYDGNLRVDLNQIVELIYKAVTNTFQGLNIIQLVQVNILDIFFDLGCFQGPTI